MLAELLEKSPLARAYPDLLVGNASSDDAAVYRVSDDLAIVATTDFFLPIVDEPYDFGRIAATNAISDVYAMGGKPFMALALAGMPLGKLPLSAMQQILAGGQSVCDAIGIPIAGGHSIDAPEPIYGLVALGFVKPAHIKRNDGARAGDVVILGKPLGVGIMSAALRKGELRDKAYQQLLECTTQLNTPGVAFGELAEVHAMTDITGFGLLGHLHEVCRGSGLRATIEFEAVPMMPAALHLARSGYVTGASDRNWEGIQQDVTLRDGIETWQRRLLCDPQTSGGLLVTCSADAAAQVLKIFADQHFGYAREIGTLSQGAPHIDVV